MSSLAKAALANLDTGDLPVEVQFNPPELLLERRAPHASERANERLVVELFFDRTTRAGSVREDLDRFHAGLGAGPDGRSPLCRFTWGPDLEFVGRVELSSARILLFDADGTPRRATVRLSLRGRSARPGSLEERRSWSRRHVVKDGETLPRIAAEAYRDPRRWPELAAHNGIEDPLALRPGDVLDLPPPGEFS
ncbi:MAG: LysM peptidoglycan-binding domain-containing protein [Planctomycetes bacterium]|nr:LysM peptidoglycan-binding domain-containing protein [Planctomycetota bacterium]